jgi:glycine C-acetyltransferase
MATLIDDINVEMAKRYPEATKSFDEHKAQGLYFYYQPINKHLPGGWVEVEGHGRMLMLGGYSYLGLLNHPEINLKAKVAIDTYGTGTQGSALLAGTLDIRRALEKKLANFKKTEDAICFSSGYVANLSTISALVNRKDVILCDKMNHASIVDGCRASMARFVRFDHNDMSSLEKKLKQFSSAGKRLVIVDAVYSMDGDIADLPQIRFLCNKYNALLMVDEAHSVGVIGKTGRGIEEYFGLPPETIDIKMGTLSKAIPSSGGYIASQNAICEFLRHTARGLLFSGATGAATLAAALAGLEMIEKEPQRVAMLQERAAYVRNRLNKVGLNTGNSQTAIIPVICGGIEEAIVLAKYCQENNLFIHAVIPPGVPKGTSRLRVSIMATHTFEDLDYCVDIIGRGARQLGLI